MNSKVEASMPIGDVVKQALSLILLVGGVGAFYYFSEFALIYRVLALIVIVILVMAVMYTTMVGRDVWSFVLDSKQEVRKVVWPSREETMRTTMLVIAMVVIVGFVLWVLDMLLFWGVRMLTGQGV